MPWADNYYLLLSSSRISQHCNTNRYYTRTNLGFAYGPMDRRLLTGVDDSLAPAYEPQAHVYCTPFPLPISTPTSEKYHRICSLCITLQRFTLTLVSDDITMQTWAEWELFSLSMHEATLIYRRTWRSYASCRRQWA